MTEHEKRHLIRALQAYRDQETHRGDYQLWVGFGDSWTSFKAKLIREGYVNHTKQGVTTLSERGEAFMAQSEPAAA